PLSPPLGCQRPQKLTRLLPRERITHRDAARGRAHPAHRSDYRTKADPTMSTTPSAQPIPVTPVTPEPREIRVYSHSGLFYWWPVWAVGFLMAVLTYFDGHQMLVVPAKTQIVDNRVVPPPNKHLPEDAEGKTLQPKLAMTRSKNYGVFFAVVLLVIILISNVPMHGLWSVLVILGILLLVLILILANWWDWLAEKWDLLDIRINMGGYAFISTILLIIWAFTIFVFDRRRYVAVMPGQVRVCQAIGTGEDVYDTTGMTFAKRQDDLFRHWIVGLGSGDLIIHRPNQKDIDMPNVLFVGSKVKEMEELVRSKEVV